MVFLPWKTRTIRGAWRFIICGGTCSFQSKRCQHVKLTIMAFHSTAELNVAIVCACMPCLKPLLVRLFPRARWLRADPRPRDLDTISDTTLSDREASTDIAERRIDWAALRANHGAEKDTDTASTCMTSAEERQRGVTEDLRAGKTQGNNSDSI